MAVVDVAWLREHLGEPGLVVVDCRWKLAEPGAGRELYEAGHIPGAGFLDVDADLSSPPGPGGRHPLPRADAFERAARRVGIDPDSRVVAYDEAGEAGAPRLWWLLRHFGHDDAAVLDGGMSAWRESGGPLEAGAPRPREGTFTARELSGDIIEAEELARRLDDPSLLLVDARRPERFSGESEPVDPVAGHIPGARNVPFVELAPEGRFLSPAELRSRLPAEGELVAYCGSGVTACTVLLAAELAGLQPGRLYAGSWSEWSGRGLPGETGP